MLRRCYMFLDRTLLFRNSFLQASHLRFPNTTVRHWSLNSLTLSDGDTFGSTEPCMFLFFSSGLVCTFLFREILAFSGVVNLAPALAAICKGSEYSSWSLEHGLSLCSAILNVWAYPLTVLWLIPQYISCRATYVQP